MFEKIKNIVGFDTGIKDNIYFISDNFFNENLLPFLNSLYPSQNKDFTKSKIEIFDRFSLKEIKHYLENYISDSYFTYGGTTPNIFYNINQIINPSSQVKIKLVATGRQSLEELSNEGIEIFLNDKSNNYAESVVLYVGEKRQKRTLIYRGDFKTTLEENLDSIKDKIFQENSFFMLMGSVLGKIGEENFSKIINNIDNLKQKKFSFNLPTDKDTSYKYSDFIQKIIPKASIIFSNLEELSYIFLENIDEDKSFTQAENSNFKPNIEVTELIKKLQSLLSGESHSLVTAGKYGAFLIGKDKFSHSQALPFIGKAYTNGAGDTTIGAYIAGLILGCNKQEALSKAMKCAVEKLKFNDSRLKTIKKFYFTS
ncbi:MAG: PfkB family carbohydrate kinase [Rickettsiales bacterium]|nr:PfkB family carbohydrate kinase [Rickettsiales bacterium]